MTSPFIQLHTAILLSATSVAALGCNVQVAEDSGDAELATGGTPSASIAQEEASTAASDERQANDEAVVMSAAAADTPPPAGTAAEAADADEVEVAEAELAEEAAGSAPEDAVAEAPERNSMEDTPSAPLGESADSAPLGADPADAVGGIAPTLPALGERGEMVDCAVTASATLSEAISTVGIVNWSTDLPNVDSACIEFGLAETGPTMVAPVDLEDPELRTLLLGMKGDRDYVYRVVAHAGELTCTSDELTLTTGPIPNHVPLVEREIVDADAMVNGFLILTSGLGNLAGFDQVSGGSPVFIIDADGDVVWWADAPNSTSRARMDWEGQNMYMLALNVGGGMGELRRVSMDGLDVEVVPEVTEGHHDFAVAPGGIVTALVHVDDCSAIVERSPDGSLTTIVETTDEIYERRGDCHPNSILYHPQDDSYTISDRNPNLYVKVARSGELLWQLGGNNPLGQAFSMATDWIVNHGHQLLPNGNMLIFNNGNGLGPSKVLEFALDIESWTASLVWEYEGEYDTPTLGDVQRLSNGNTLVTFSNAGVIQELDTAGNLVHELSGGSIGYTMYRESLYGPPPK